MHNKKRLNELKSDFYKGPTHIVRVGLDASALVVYFFLTTCSEDFHPSIRYIAKCVKLNKNTVCKAIATLEELNIISLLNMATPGKAAEYEFNPPAIWKANRKKSAPKVS